MWQPFWGKGWWAKRLWQVFGVRGGGLTVVAVSWGLGRWANGVAATGVWGGGQMKRRNSGIFTHAQELGIRGSVQNQHDSLIGKNIRSGSPSDFS